MRRDRTMFDQEQQLLVTAYYRNATQLSTTQEMLRARDKESTPKGKLCSENDREQLLSQVCCRDNVTHWRRARVVTRLAR